MANDITSCKIRMYTMGTGDCFLLSFFSDDDQTTPKFKLMIDCGVIKISSEKMQEYAEDIINHTGGKVDALLITHEHQDHVLGFERAEKLFTEQFETNELWLPWTENTSDPLVASWKKEYGKKKLALAEITHLLKKSTENPLFNEIFQNSPASGNHKNTRLGIANALSDISDLNGTPLDSGNYIGSLKGMEIAQNNVKNQNVRYLEPGSIFEKLDGLDNIRIYVLGPPKLWKSIRTTEGKGEEVYRHNSEIELVKGFSSLPFEDEDNNAPFDEHHICHQLNVVENYSETATQYADKNQTFRRIDYDWLLSAATLGLRVTSGINNLSAVIAIEFIKSGKIMLFPGDAEYGSWASWHNIKWNRKGRDSQVHLTTDILNRTVFYKVAHHLSSNGTAKKEGMELMPEKGMTAMATLDYNVIQPNWTSTMPNRDLLKDLLKATEGRFFVSNLDKLFLDKAQKKTLKKEIENIRKGWSKEDKKDFKSRVNESKYFIEYHLDGK